MNSRERFLKACKMEALNRPPVWVMRQAGRYLPEYRALKEKHSFVEMVKTPEIAAEVTLQPMKRFDLDAAIIFSDILVIPEALGMPYSFREKGGIEMSGRIETAEDVAKLDGDGISQKLQYVGNSLKLTRNQLGAEKALIGFCGSPWTVATYMIEGGSSRDFSRAKSLLMEKPDLFHLLLEKITTSTIDYLEMQIEAGIDVVQIFDSWGGALSKDTFWSGSAHYMNQIVKAVEDKIPVIIFSKGSHDKINDLKKIGGDVYGVDSSIFISQFWDDLGGGLAVQGNLNPDLMSTTPEIVKEETHKILNEFGERNGLIFNLGHGIKPDGKIECMQALVETVVNFNKNSQSIEPTLQQ